MAALLLGGLGPGLVGVTQARQGDPRDRDRALGASGCRVPELTGLVLSVARERAARAGCRIRLSGARVERPDVQRIRGQRPRAGRHGRVVTVRVDRVCSGSALPGPPEDEPLLRTGPTELISGLYLDGGPLRLRSEPRCTFRAGVPGAGTITVRDPAGGAVVATQVVTSGHLAMIPLAAGTYTVEGTFAQASINGQPGRSFPRTVDIPAGKTVREDVVLNVP